MEERYPSKGAYVVAVRKAADKLVSARLLLPEDAKRLAGEALQLGQAPLLSHAGHQQSCAQWLFQRRRLGATGYAEFTTLGAGLHLK